MFPFISGQNCDDGLCNDSRKLSPAWYNIFGTDFPESGQAGEKAWDIIKVDNYIYVLGNIWADEDNLDLILLKYTEEGKLIWNKTWDGGLEDEGFVIISDGSFLYVGGLTFVEFGGATTSRSLFQIYDLDGNLLISKTWGDNVDGHHEVDGLALADDYLYVSHWNATRGLVKSRAVIKKLDKAGNIIWSRSFGDPEKFTTADGHIYADNTGVWIAGRLNSDYFLVGGDAYITKFDSNGNQMWIQTFGGDYFDNALSLASDGEYIYITGWTQVKPNTGFEGVDAMLAKYELDGNMVWEKTVGGDKLELSRGVAVDDSYLYVPYITASWGNGGTDTLLAKYDKITGELITYGYWGEQGLDEVASSIIVDNDFVYISGRTSSYGKNFDAVFMKVPIINCGDGICNLDENCSACPDDCGICLTSCKGENCDKYGIGEKCSIDDDCESGKCRHGICIEIYTCRDHKLTLANFETDIDCRGYICPDRCDVDMNCIEHTDCMEGMKCKDDVCTQCAENDFDCDGIPDGDADWDDDSLNNIEEEEFSTGPNNPDTDDTDGWKAGKVLISLLMKLLEFGRMLLAVIN